MGTSGEKNCVNFVIQINKNTDDGKSQKGPCSNKSLQSMMTVKNRLCWYCYDNFTVSQACTISVFLGGS